MVPVSLTVCAQQALGVTTPACHHHLLLINASSERKFGKASCTGLVSQDGHEEPHSHCPVVRAERRRFSFGIRV